MGLLYPSILTYTLPAAQNVVDADYTNKIELSLNGTQNTCQFVTVAATIVIE